MVDPELLLAEVKVQYSQAEMIGVGVSFISQTRVDYVRSLYIEKALVVAGSLSALSVLLLAFFVSVWTFSLSSLVTTTLGLSFFRSKPFRQQAGCEDYFCKLILRLILYHYSFQTSFNPLARL